MLYDALQFTYTPTFRRNHKLTVDHQFNLFWQRKWRYSIGYVVFNDNTKLKYRWDNQIRIQNIEYDALAVAITAPVKKIVNIELKIMYARSGFPNNPEREAMLYGLRVFHVFRFWEE